MKPYIIYAVLITLMCSCSLKKKALMRIRTEANIETARMETSESHDAVLLDTSRIEMEESVITERIIPEKHGGPTVSRTIHYRKVTGHKGLKVSYDDKVNGSYGINSIETKASVNTTKTTEAKAEVPVWYFVVAVGLPLSALCLIIIMIRRKNN